MRNKQSLSFKGQKVLTQWAPTATQIFPERLIKINFNERAGGLKHLILKKIDKIMCCTLVTAAIADTTALLYIELIYQLF